MVLPLMEMKNIHKWFGKVYALKGVDVHVNPSEILGIVGDNGAGKSTLIKILTGVFKADGGDIFFEGKKVRFSSPKDARDSGIETIYQEQALADEVNVSRNMFMGKELLKFIGPIGILDRKKMDLESSNLLKSLGLNIPSMHQQVKFCSGGERQGMAIARALYFNAQLVILDEPTRALGVQAVEHIIKLIKEMKKRGISTVVISHNIHHVYSVADRFIIMVRGKVVAEMQKKDTSVNKLIYLMSHR